MSNKRIKTKTLNVFLTWIKDNIVATLTSTAAIIAAIGTIAKLFNPSGLIISRAYLLPTAAGLFCLATTLFLFWIITDPKLNQDKGSGGVVASLFSPRCRYASKVGIPINVIAGGVIVFLLIPSPTIPIKSLCKYPAFRTSHK
jgi:hypothetical protein